MLVFSYKYISTFVFCIITHIGDSILKKKNFLNFLKMAD